MAKLQHPPRQRGARQPSPGPAAERAGHDHRCGIGELLFKKGPNRRHLVGRMVKIVLGLAAVITAVFVFTELEWADARHLIDLRAVASSVDRLNPAAIIPLMAILPVFGFPVSLVYLIAGARFGPLWGGLVVLVATAVHLLAAHGIGRSVLRGPLERFIDRHNARLPEIREDEQAMVALIVALVPGIPYVVRIYLLALASIPLRKYFWICLGVYVARSYVAILFGDLSSEPNGRGLMILLAADVLKVAICGFVIWRLRLRHRRSHGAPAAAHG